MKKSDKEELIEKEMRLLRFEILDVRNVLNELMKFYMTPDKGLTQVVRKVFALDGLDKRLDQIISLIYLLIIELAVIMIIIFIK